MKTVQAAFKVAAALLFTVGFITGCGTTDGNSVSTSGSVYYGAGFYDPWYYGGYYPPDVIVTPPPGDRPPALAPHPEHPIAKPPSAPAPSPRPMPSIPSTPRASFRR